jgi:hypothetical protein
LAETAVLREKFRRDGYTISDAIQKMRAIGNHVTPTEVLAVVKEVQVSGTCTLRGSE